eukprot:m.129321 g.129321  ORF g.129321 m.129321 type:complete len:116 (-) comp16759_c0_seq1:2854-3201(-)
MARGRPSGSSKAPWVALGFIVFLQAVFLVAVSMVLVLYHRPGGIEDSFRAMREKLGASLTVLDDIEGRFGHLLTILASAADSVVHNAYEVCFISTAGDQSKFEPHGHCLPLNGTG